MSCCFYRTEEKPKAASGYHVYSCGDGNVLEHVPQKLDREAVSVSKLISEQNPDYRVSQANQTLISEIMFVAFVVKEKLTCKIYIFC